MNMTAINVRGLSLRVFAGSALAVAAAATIAVPSAKADPAPCTAAGLSSTVSGVTGAAASYLGSHPDVDQAITSAGGQSTQDAQQALQAYFVTHPQELVDLRGIAAPLSELRGRCNQSVSPGQIAALLQAFGA
jgi:heme-binding protein